MRTLEMQTEVLTKPQKTSTDGADSLHGQPVCSLMLAGPGLSFAKTIL